MTARAPSSAALEIATVIPRSLNDPVGFAPSTFRYTSHPVRSDNTGAGTSGVPPSNRVTTGVRSVTGSRARYAAMTPGQGCTSVPAEAFDAHDARGAAHEGHTGQRRHGVGQCPVGGGVGH